MKPEACTDGMRDSLLLRYKTDMLAPFRVLGRFWDADRNSYPPSAGILEWLPGRESRVAVLPAETENGIADVIEPQGKSACLHGQWLANIDGAEMGACYLSVEAVTAGGYEGYGPYRFAEREYVVSSIWKGSRLVKPSESVFSQMAFSFCGLDNWIEHEPDVPVREHNGRLAISGSKWDVIRDMNISDVGNVCLLAGYEVSGVQGKSETLKASHIWHVDFRSARTWLKCQQALGGVAKFLSDRSGRVPVLKTLTLAEELDTEPNGGVFAVSKTDTPNLSEDWNGETLYQGPMSVMRDLEETKFGDFLGEHISKHGSARKLAERTA